VLYSHVDCYGDVFDSRTMLIRGDQVRDSSAIYIYLHEQDVCNVSSGVQINFVLQASIDSEANFYRDQLYPINDSRS